MPWSGPQKKHIQLPPEQEHQHVVGPSTSSAVHGRNSIPDEAYRRIRQIDEQTSTLTARGVQGFSTRVLSKDEKVVDLGNGRREAYVFQLIEIIKKPGQSLGIYLREGNGIDRDVGVFVSRLASGTDIEQSGLIQPGDEILYVNDVCVKELPLESVVYTLSITRRLVLRTSYLKSRREVAAQEERPVVMFQKSTDSGERRDSEASSTGGGILARPGTTANTWLGKKVRRQLQQQQQIEGRDEPSAPEKPTISGQQNLMSAQQQQQQQNFNQQQFHHPNVMPFRQKQPPPQQQQRGWPPYQDPHSQQFQRTAPAIIPPPRTDVYHSSMDSSGIYQHPQQQQQQQYYPSQHQIYAPLAHQQQPPSSSTMIYASPVQQPYYAAGPTPNRPSFPSAPYGTMRRPANPIASAPVQRRHFPSYPLPVPFYSPYCSRSVVGGVAPYAPPDLMDPYGQQRASLQSAYPLPGEMHGVPYPGGSNSLPRRHPSPATVIGGTPRTVKWRNDVLDSDIADILDSPTGKTPPSQRRPTLGRSAISDVEAEVANTSRRPIRTRNLNWERGGGGTMREAGMVPSYRDGRTVADIFSAQDYRNWAAPSGAIEIPLGEDRRSRWAAAMAPPSGISSSSAFRSSSLPSKTLLERNANLFWVPNQPRPEQTIEREAYGRPFDPSIEKTTGVFDRLHLSPMLNRRVPLKTAGPGFDVDRLSGTFNALTGILSISIAEGKDLKVPDKIHSKSMYVVVEVNEEHRARTGISLPEQHFRWNERFEIDVYKANDVQFFVYAWHPQLRHRFCHKGAIRLMDAFFVDQLTGQKFFALKMERDGQLIIKIGFSDMAECYRRQTLTPHTAGRLVFGQPLSKLIQVEQKESPVVLTRLIKEIEARGVDTAGIYYLSGAVERKLILRNELERDPQNTDIGIGPVPDINLLSCLVKDFLRELPEPLVPPNVYVMLNEAVSLILPSDTESNQKLILKIIDCLPKSNRNTLILLMDHFRNLMASEPLNGLNSHRLTTVFGPLIFCTSRSYPSVMGKVELLSIEQAAQCLKLLLDHWPRVNNNESSESSSPPNSLTAAKEPSAEHYGGRRTQSEAVNNQQ